MATKKTIHNKALKNRFLNWAVRPRTYKIDYYIKITVEVPNVKGKAEARRKGKELLVKKPVISNIKHTILERIW